MLTGDGYVKASIHVHESTASDDSMTRPEDMCREYIDRGYGLVGFVGHDDTPDIEECQGVECVTGIEHEVTKSPRRLHVVEFPAFDFKFLAHPKLTWPDNTRENASEYIERNDIDAVEKWSRGDKQYDGTIDGVKELANDDAHNVNQIGSSHMIFRTSDVFGIDGIEAENFFNAIAEGNYRAVKKDKSVARSAGGRLKQGIALLRNGEW